MSWTYLALYAALGLVLVALLARYRRGTERPVFFPAVVFVVIGYAGLYLSLFEGLITGGPVFPDDRGIGPSLDDTIVNGGGFFGGQQGLVGSLAFIAIGFVILAISRRNARRAARERERRREA